MCAVFSAAAFGLVGSNLSWDLVFPGLPASHLELESRGTIHLRRRHALGGRGQKFAKFADG